MLHCVRYAPPLTRPLLVSGRRIGFVAALCLGSSVALAESWTAGIPFATSGQSIWGTGPAAGLPPFNRFSGIDWNTGGSFGGILEAEIGGDRICVPLLGCVTLPKVDLGDYGIKLDASSAGKVGFTAKLELDAGSVAVTYPVKATLRYTDYPSIRFGAPVQIASGFTIDPSARLATVSPTGTAGLDFDFEMSAKLGSRLCFIDCARDTPIDFQVDKTLSIIQVSSKTPTTTNLFGGAASVTAKIPDIVTSGGLSGNKLVSSGADPLIGVDIDVDRIATNLLGLPPLGAQIGSGRLYFSYDILDLRAGVDLDVVQKFTFQADPWVRLDFDQPVTVVGETVPRTSLAFPLGDGVGFTAGRSATAVEVTPTFFLQNAHLTNETSLSVDPNFSLKVLQGQLHVDFPSTVNKLIGDIDAGFGPVFALAKTARGPAIDIFSEQFDLDGFTPVTGGGFQILGNPLELLGAVIKPASGDFRIPDGGFRNDIPSTLVLTIRNTSPTAFRGSTFDLSIHDADCIFAGDISGCRIEDRFTRADDELLDIAGAPLGYDLPGRSISWLEIPIRLSEFALNEAIDETIFPLPRPDEGDFLEVFGTGLLRFADAEGRVAQVSFRANVPEPGTLLILAGALAARVLRSRRDGRGGDRIPGNRTQVRIPPGSAYSRDEN